MTKCVCLCFNCRQNYNSTKGYFCLNGKFIPGVSNADTTVERAPEDLRGKNGFDFGRRGRINDTTLVGAKFCNENSSLSNENDFSNQVNYGYEQSSSSQDYAKKGESNLLMALNSELDHIREGTVGDVSNSALFHRCTLDTKDCNKDMRLDLPTTQSSLNIPRLRSMPSQIGPERAPPIPKLFNNSEQVHHIRPNSELIPLKYAVHIIHDGVNRYECDICRKLFTTRDNLDSHICTHTGERPFVCIFCGKQFRHKGHFNVHLRIHYNEKPYACETCGKLFTHKSNLRAHTLTHTDEKPFTCEICGKKFKSRNGKKKHMKNHQQK